MAGGLGAGGYGLLHTPRRLTERSGVNLTGQISLNDIGEISPFGRDDVVSWVIGQTDTARNKGLSRSMPSTS